MTFCWCLCVSVSVLASLVGVSLLVSLRQCIFVGASLLVSHCCCTLRLSPAGTRLTVYRRSSMVSLVAFCMGGFRCVCVCVCVCAGEYVFVGTICKHGSAAKA